MVDDPRILVVDENDDNRVELQKMLGRAGLADIGEARYGANAAAVANDLQPDAILVGIEEPPNRALETIETLSKLLLETPIIAYSAIQESGAMRRATRAGVRDYLLRPLDPGMLREAILDALEQEEQRRLLRAGGVPPPVRGSVITVTGAKGGIGKSILAINLALALRQVTGRTVALVDCDTHFGDVAMMLNLPAEPPVTHSITMIDKLDRRSVRDQSVEHRTGVRVYPSPSENEEWDSIQPERVARFVALLAESFDFVVIDTPDVFDRVVESCIADSTLVLLLTSLDISSIADTKLALRTLRNWDVSPEKVRVAVNHTRKRVGLSERNVAEALSWPVFWSIPFDSYVADTAQLGQSLLEKSPNASFSRNLRGLAGAISGAGSGGRSNGRIKPSRSRGLLGLFRRRPEPGSEQQGSVRPAPPSKSEPSESIPRAEKCGESMSRWTWDGYEGDRRQTTSPASTPHETSIADPSESPAAPATTRRSGSVARDVDDISGWLHQRLIRQMDPAAMRNGGGGPSRSTVDSAARALLAVERPDITGVIKEEAIAVVIDEMVGFGPIDTLLRDPDISEVMVNGVDAVYYERDGKLYESALHFHDDQHIMRIVERIIGPIGRRVDESSPMVDARLPDGSRVNVIIPPLAPDCPILTIRKFRTDRFGMNDLVRIGSMTAEIRDFLHACIGAKINTVISGGTGSGKTTLLNALSAFLGSGERIITIEDPLELQLQQRHVVRLEARPPGIEGQGEVAQRDLFRNSLRMRPDRIIVGEVRGAEAFDMLQAMNTGHEGSLTTLHANSPRDALARIESMVLLAGLEIPVSVIREQIGSALHLIIHVARLPDGSRRVTHITEVAGMEGNVVTTQDIFRFVVTGTAEDGRIEGHFQAQGVRPRFAEKLETFGYVLRPDVFTSGHVFASST